MAYLKTGIREEKRSEIRDCNLERDTGFGHFTKRDLGNVILKSRDLGSPLSKMSPHVKVSESGIQRIFAFGIQNPGLWNPESNFLWNLESSI